MGASASYERISVGFFRAKLPIPCKDWAGRRHSHRLTLRA